MMRERVDITIYAMEKNPKRPYKIDVFRGSRDFTMLQYVYGVYFLSCTEN